MNACGARAPTGSKRRLQGGDAVSHHLRIAAIGPSTVGSKRVSASAMTSTIRRALEGSSQICMLNSHGHGRGRRARRHGPPNGRRARRHGPPNGRRARRRGLRMVVVLINGASEWSSSHIPPSRLSSNLSPAASCRVTILALDPRFSMGRSRKVSMAFADPDDRFRLAQRPSLGRTHLVGVRRRAAPEQ